MATSPGPVMTWTEAEKADYLQFIRQTSLSREEQDWLKNFIHTKQRAVNVEVGFQLESSRVTSPLKLGTKAGTLGQKPRECTSC